MSVRCRNTFFCIGYLCALSIADATLMQPLIPPTQKNNISLSFVNIPIPVLLQLLAKTQGQNILLDPAITGNTDITLQNISFDTAWRSVLKMHQLRMSGSEGIWLIKPDVGKRQKAANVQARWFDVQHTNVQDIANHLREDKHRILSEQGRLVVDENKHRILIENIPEQQNLIKQTIAALDSPKQQVHIEARIVTLDQGIDEALGVRWGSSVLSGRGFAGSLESLAGDASIASKLHVNLPVPEAAGRLAYRLAMLNNRYLLDLELSALEKEDKAEIIASPSIVTLNRTTAVIEQGTEIPYVEAAASGATSVVFKKAVLSLSVTPEINAEQHIVLHLDLSQDTQGETVSTPTGPAVSINAQNMNTRVRVANGQTLALGGIYQQIQVKNETKVPIIGDILWLGALFRQTRYEQRKRELVIFVTPTIIDNKE